MLSQVCLIFKHQHQIQPSNLPKEGSKQMDQEMQVAASHISPPKGMFTHLFLLLSPFYSAWQNSCSWSLSGAEHLYSIFPLSSAILISSSLPSPGLGTVPRPQKRCLYLKGPWPGGKCSRRGVSQGKKYQGSGLHWFWPQVTLNPWTNHWFSITQFSHKRKVQCVRPTSQHRYWNGLAWWKEAYIL